MAEYKQKSPGFETSLISGDLLPGERINDEQTGTFVVYDDSILWDHKNNDDFEDSEISSVK